MKWNTIVLGDCIEEIKKMPSQSVDLIFTDPPYNISQKRVFRRKDAKNVNLYFGDWDYFETEEAYIEWAKQWIQECFRVLKPDGHLVIWQGKLLPLRKTIEEVGFEIRNVLVWIKSNPLPQFQKVNFVSSMEFLIWATKKGSLRKNQVFHFSNHSEMFNVQLEKGEPIDAETVLSYLLNSSVEEKTKYEIFFNEEGIVAFRSSIVMGKERLPHPTQKPLYITEKLIKLFTNENDVVLDLFMGTGTVAEACLRANRLFYGIEKDPTYHQMALDRIASYLENCKE